MHSSAARVMLSCLLPPELASVMGEHQSMQDGCWVEILRLTHTGRAIGMNVCGPSRTAVFDQARRMLQSAEWSRSGPLTIDASLHSTTPRGLVREPWTVILGADVAFAATAVPVDVGRADPQKQDSVHHDRAPGSHPRGGG